MANKHEGKVEAMSAVEKQAKKFIHDMADGKHNKDSYEWPKIDFKEASPESWKTILSLLDPEPPRGSNDNTISTPARVRIRREVDFLVEEQQFIVKKRILDSQKINDNLKKNIPILLDFLRAARHDNTVGFEFPHAEWKILQSIDEIRGCLRGAEEILKLSVDSDATSEDSQAIQMGDVTLVN